MSTEKKLSIAGYGITACVYLAVILWLADVFGSISGDEVALWCLGFYIVIIIPATSLVTGLVLGIKNAFLKWLYPVIFGACSLIIPCLLADELTFEIAFLLISFAPALLGVTIGVFIRKLRS